MARTVILALVALLPWAIKKHLYALFFGYTFGARTRIGLAFIDVGTLDMSEGSAIGSFTFVRNLDRLVLGEGAKIGTFNWIFGMRTGRSGSHFALETGRDSSLVVGAHAAITSRHLIDCIDRVEIGEFTTVAGFRSQILTHAIDLKRNRQSCAPVLIGKRCFVGTGALILKGVSIPECSVIAAGAVVGHSFEEPGCLIGGNPAAKVREIDRDAGYFVRTSGRVQ